MSQLFASGGQSLAASASASFLPMKYSELISLRIDWFDRLAVQETLKSLLQYHNLKASVIWPSAFSIAQLSHLYMTMGKIIAFMIWTFSCKVMSLFFNMLSKLA